MPRLSKLTGWYVTARLDPGTANQATAWLVGPFDTDRAAMAMVDAVSYACRHYMDDPRYQFAFYGHTKLTNPADKPLPFGGMPLELLSREGAFDRIVAPRTDWRMR